MTNEDSLRQQLARFTDFGEAHVTSDAVLAELDFPLQGKRAQGLPHSPWELLEHIRITQHDILDFCVNPKYEEMQWPEDYWPKSAAPPAADSWKKSVAAFPKGSRCAPRARHRLEDRSLREDTAWRRPDAICAS